MFSDILSFLRFVTDPETRKTIVAVSGVVSSQQKNWKTDIKTATANFSGDEGYKTSSFANYLLEDLKTVGISNDKISHFRIVFTELIHNAFEHGCQNAKSRKVAIRCTYSRWFIRLEVADTGKGFNLANTLEKHATIGGRHGLLVVRELAHRLYTNKKGNIVTVLLAGQDSLDILPAIEKYKGFEILIVNVQSEWDWNYITESWEPLRRAVENMPQDLILVDCSSIMWITKRTRDVEEIVTEFKERKGKCYAFVVDHRDGKYFHLKAFDSDNFRVFFNNELHQAKNWLIQHKRSTHGSSNRRAG